MKLRRRWLGSALCAALLASVTAAAGARGVVSTIGGGCTPVAVRYPDGSLRQLPGPPAPHLDVRAVSAHKVRFAWQFRSLPPTCRPASLLLTVLPGDNRYTPYTEPVSVTAAKGTYVMKLPSFYVRSNTALASALTRKGLRSKVVRVAIRG